MPVLLWIILATFVGGALSALAASSFLIASESMRVRVLVREAGEKITLES